MSSILKVDTVQKANGTTAKPGDLGLDVTDSILQIVQSGTLADFGASTTNTWVDTNMTLSITPSSTSSKVLVNFTVIQRIDGSGSIYRAGYRIARTVSGTSTVIYNTAGSKEHIQVRNAAGEASGIGGYIYLDSPATTSAVTYTLQANLNNDSGASFVRARASSAGANVILMEVSG